MRTAGVSVKAVNQFLNVITSCGLHLQAEVCFLESFFSLTGKSERLQMVLLCLPFPWSVWNYLP